MSAKTTLQECIHATEVHLQVLQKVNRRLCNTDRNLRNVLEGMNITLAKLKVVEEELS